MNYRERLHAGHYEPSSSDDVEVEVEVVDDTPALPRTHADLDELVNQRGLEWSSEDLTVAEKQAELNGE